ncbi:MULTISPECIES: hypothetical protein [Fischerella]|uniref:hypothetical protein n=1 Tax=Fischerella TaxID=1190 RepID=UPI0011AEF483|nr:MULTISPECIES: hypothetical protein [Fischerella]MBD2433816.1 hypothetical protein [Fischerella sp. FACHB-380]
MNSLDVSSLGGCGYEGAATATINGIAISIIFVIDYSYPGVIGAIAYTELTAIALYFEFQATCDRPHTVSL